MALARKGRRPQHQRDRGPRQIVVRHRVGREDAGRRAVHAQPSRPDWQSSPRTASRARGIGGQLVVPGGRAARPRMGGRRQEDEARASCSGWSSAKAAATAPPNEWPTMIALSMPRWSISARSCRPGRPGSRCRWPASRPAMAGPVEEQHLGAAFEQRPQRQHLVVQIGAGAMDEDHRRQVGIWRRRDVDVVDAGAVDVDEAADRRIAPLDQPEPTRVTPASTSTISAAGMKAMAA